MLQRLMKSMGMLVCVLVLCLLIPAAADAAFPAVLTVPASQVRQDKRGGRRWS